jgi:predicted MFS family arabinose efflux permease
MAPNPGQPGPGQRGRLDTVGLLLLAGGLAALLLGVSQGGTAGWGTWTSWLPAATGLALLACYLPWSTRTAEPALDLSLARSRSGALALTLCATASVVTFAAVFVLPVFMQAVQGHSALATGLAMLPQGLITGLSTTLGQRALRLVTVRATVLAGFALLTVASVGLLGIGARTPLPVIAALLAGRAASIGLVISPLLAAMTGPLRPEQLGDASTVFSIWQRVAGSLGVGVIASVYAEQAAAHGPVHALHVTGVLVTLIAAAGLVAAPLLPAERNVVSYPR